MMHSFVHLQLHTEYSLADGLLRVGTMVRRAAELGMPAIAVTERDNLFSLVKFYKAAQSAGVKPIAGCDVLVGEPGARQARGRALLLCQSREGYRGLSRLITRAYAHARAGSAPRVDASWIAEDGEDLLVVSAGRGGVLANSLLSAPRADLEREVDWWRAHFPDRLYLAVTRTGRDGEEALIDASVDAAVRWQLPLVATNDVCFLDESDFDAHEARVCIHEGRTLADPRRPRQYSPQQYLRTPEEMQALFADLPQALENTVELATRCNLDLPLGETHLPGFPVPDGQSADEWFRQCCSEGLEQRLLERFGDDPEALERERPTYEARMEREVGVIIDMGFPGYFLIVADFIAWARENGVPVGPGRGSGAGSLAAWCMRITDLDPIAYDLLFERFLNPERVSLPDFDVDFCMDGRDRVIDYVSRRYSADQSVPRVSQIITYGTMAAKAVVRDVGRVLGHPYGFVDQVAKLIPFELGMTLEKALKDEALASRYEEDEEVRAIIDLARKLEGVARNAGRHAGGVVIAPSALTDFTPLYCEPGGGMVTQFDMKDVESVGLVKFDFLGLRTLTIIDRAVKAINETRIAASEPELDMLRLPMRDTATFDLIKAGRTTAVFQLESRGMKELIRRLLPDRFDDIIALVALFRPGPLQSGMVDDFIARKHGREEVVYPHADLEPVLEPTYGVILYQEQVMQIAQVLAGYSLGGADLLRRAMGKKLPEEMAKQRQGFVDGSIDRGVDGDLAGYIFDLIEKFAGYGFNKSHSAAYALIAYQTAWLKAHYPAEFMAAVLSADMDNTDKVVVFVDECRELELEVAPPDVNLCGAAFSAIDGRTVRFGLGAVKGVGEGAVEAIVEEREARGPFVDLFDFCVRVDGRKVNRRVMEALIHAGAMDGLGPHRGSVMANLTRALQVAEQQARDSQAGQNDMFGGVASPASETASFDEAAPWDDERTLAGEKATLGVYFSGHPVARFEGELSELVSAPLGRIRPDPGKAQRVAGLVVNLRSMNTRNGRMAVLTLEDRTGRMDVVVYADLFSRVRPMLERDRVLVAGGIVGDDEFTGGCSMVAESVLDIAGARQALASHLSLWVTAAHARNGLVNHLKEAMLPHRGPGRTPVRVHYEHECGSGVVTLGPQWRIHPCDELLGALGDLLGEDRVKLEYLNQAEAR